MFAGGLAFLLLRATLGARLVVKDEGSLTSACPLPSAEEMQKVRALAAELGIHPRALSLDAEGDDTSLLEVVEAAVSPEASTAAALAPQPTPRQLATAKAAALIVILGASGLTYAGVMYGLHYLGVFEGVHEAYQLAQQGIHGCGDLRQGLMQLEMHDHTGMIPDCASAWLQVQTTYKALKATLLAYKQASAVAGMSTGVALYRKLRNFFLNLQGVAVTAAALKAPDAEACEATAEALSEDEGEKGGEDEEGADPPAKRQRLSPQLAT